MASRGFAPRDFFDQLADAAVASPAGALSAPTFRFTSLARWLSLRNSLNK
jgi:hypothetical protein